MSQGTYKITEARQGRTYTGKHGDLVVWQVTLENAQPENGAAAFELHKKPGNTPQPGDVIEVDRFAPGEHDGAPYVRIFAASQQSAGGSTSSSAGGDSKNFDRRPEHPRNEARMIHTSAMSAAPSYIEQMLTIGVAAQPKDEDAYWALVGHVAGRLAKSYEKALGDTGAAPAASQGRSNGSPQQAEVPGDTAELVPAPAGVGDSIPF